ncbi:MAG: hypothetical protein AUI04_00555 [Candidatus Rokubacteria bacterium 13_2_20CM_2_64_8]|jgi:hypothetical protein|nr:MAG: hypothetical protein AUI04_00555 [Candidatus Rokubacteria bacterium 13_2_20CM_2_64_8]PYM87707.1 MAG: hypothetical protein DME08_28565 [Candidatus Rokubacteria bacterium]PYN64916.1 MAG: hypothetical protein DMD90_11935 [Candidatus Rokubacteria bacterium]PYO03956.1 MAG: hypothetical protein DMD89_00675 [Candidatus Rokubacteria bacterium]
MNLAADLEHFGVVHRPHGRFVARVGDDTPNGYRLKVSCTCGVTLERWVTQDDAVDDVLRERLGVQPT